jgi:hypothetical protein
VECKVSKQCKEWLNISEIANLLNCSRPTVYKRFYTIDTDTLQSLQRKEKGVMYYNYKIIDILKDNSSVPPVDTIQEAAAGQTDTDKSGERNSPLSEEYIQSLKDDIVFLRSQVKDLNERLAAEQELHRNTQVLFKQQQPQDIKALEAHQHDIDIKLSEIRQNMSIRQNTPVDNIFKRLFKRNKGGK